MWTRQHKQRNTGRLIVPAIATAFLSYFGFHAYHGEFGIYAKYRYEEREVVLAKELARARDERVAFERRATMLHDGTIERDMLDEQARRALNVARTDELVIMRPRPAN